MEYNPGIAMLMASAMMTKLANRKPPTDEEVIAKKSEIESNVKAVEKAEWEEMQRCPRSYYRRRNKMLSRSKVGGS